MEKVSCCAHTPFWASLHIIKIKRANTDYSYALSASSFVRHKQLPGYQNRSLSHHSLSNIT